MSEYDGIHFPKAGLDVAGPFSRQQPRDVGEGEYSRSTPVGINVRAYVPHSDRARGGSRSGLTKWLAKPLILNWVVQGINTIIHTGAGFGNPMQLNQSGRVVVLLAVSQGNLYVAGSGDTDWTLAQNNTGDIPPLNFTGVVNSTSCIQQQWFADGINAVVYTPRTNSIDRWSATAGLLPVDSNQNRPRLICTWRGRIVQSGLIGDPQDWFMSAVNDPTNWDYSPVSVTPTQAIAGNNAPAGLVGDVVTALIPYNDDTLVMGGDHTIWVFRGDPMAGGQIDRLSDSIGIAWGNAWARDPYGNIYFVSNHMGIYMMTPGQGQPQRISQNIEKLIQDVDTGANTISLVWNDNFQGLHVFITPTGAPATCTHYFYEQRTGGWWQDQFAVQNYNPLTTCVFDGNNPNDRRVLIGSWDGFVRFLDATADTDDGAPIYSSVMIGPLTTKDMDDILLKDLQATLAESSLPVSFSIFVGTSAEKALASQPFITGTWQPGRNPLEMIRASGYAIYIQISSQSQWAMEEIRSRLSTLGKVRRRGF